MLGRLRGFFSPPRSTGDGQGVIGSVFRNNRVVPVVIGMLIILIFAWILIGVSGVLSGDGEEQSLSNRAAVSQNGGATGENGPDAIAPEVENRNVDSYAAYESKDPFRQILEPAEEEAPGSTTGTTTPEEDEDTGEDTSGGTTNGTGEDEGSDGDEFDPGEANDGGNGSRRGSRRDRDNDGLSDRRERVLGTDPEDPDTDGDGIRDGRDDANQDGLPDSGGASDELFDSGGNPKYGGK